MTSLFRRPPPTTAAVDADADADADAGLAAAYGALASRYASTTAFQWQLPAFGVAAEAALLAGNLNADTQTARWLLSGVAMVIAFAAIGAMRRAELTAWWDRALLDEYETRLVPEELRLHHGLNLRQRLQKRPATFGKSSRSLAIQLRLTRLAPPSLLLALSLISLAGANLGVALTETHKDKSSHQTGTSTTTRAPPPAGITVP